MGHAGGRLEFGFEQGWARGLTLVFGTREESATLDRENFFYVDQFHGRDILEIGPSAAAKAGAQGRADGVMAVGDLAKGLARPLLIRTADCGPIAYVDRASERIALVHAGWRGLAAGIHRRPFEDLGFDPATTWVWVGPCLNGRNFEVGEDMWSQFGRAAADPKFFSPVAGRADKRHFQSWAYLEAEFSRLRAEVFYNVEVDTFENEEFASYRRAKARGETLGQQNFTRLGFGS